MRRLLSVLALVCAAGLAHAQVDRATITGAVRDESGAAIPRAVVSVRNAATGVVARVTATEDGTYIAVDLRPGRYVLEAESEGFQKKAQAVLLDVGQRARVDFTLVVGQITEAVVVEEARRLLNTEQAVVGMVLDQAAVSKLPLAIRNWDDLLALVPGVQGDRFTEEGGGTSFGRTGGINVHGNRSLQNNFLLDGVDNNSISTNVQELTTQVSRPSIDAIQEFKVITSPYSAEYGRSPGAAISVITKSGTNEFHGALYDYYRNDRFDANNFFSRRAGADKPSNDQNQFGANLGGPVVRDQAFFFVDYERTKITRGVTRIGRVPTADERRGVFTSTVRDPLTGQPFPNNTIPADRIDPVAAAILGLVPPPNQGGANNFFRQPELTDDADRLLTRFDLKVGDSDNVFARYIYSNRERFIPGLIGGILDGTSTSAFGDMGMKSHGVVLGWTRIMGSSLVNEMRVSYTRADSDAVQEPFGEQPPGAAIIPNTPDSEIVAGGFPGITVDGFFGGSGLGRLGSPDFLPKFQHTRQLEILNTLSWVKDRHQMKFGVNVMPMMSNEYMDVPATRGSMRFRGRFTGNSLGDFLLGYVGEAQLSNPFVVEQRHWSASVFVQDDWRVSDKLMVNAGLRYDFITPALEKDNHQANFIPEGSGRLILASDGSLEDRGLVKTDKNNFAPRVGIVYKANDKTVLRGGYGIFYNLFDRIGSEDQLALNPPGLVNNAIATSSATTPIFTLRDGFPPGFFAPINLDPAAGQLRNLRLRAVSQDAPKAMVHQMSVGAQREFGIFTVSLDGVLSYGRNLANLVNLNQPPGGSGPVPYPQFGFIEWREHKASSSYKGVDLALEKRFADGWSAGVAYTLSEARDNSSEHLSAQGSTSFPQNARDIDAWEGPSDFDVRHRLAVHFVAELPFGEGKKWAQEGAGRAIFGGWTLSGIFAARSGRPFTVTQGTNNVGINMTGLPNLIGDPEGPQTIERWFDPTAFQAVPSGTFGNEPRNTLRGPGWKGLDMSLSRRVRFGDRTAVVARWDVFNVFDTVNYGLPDRNLTSATVATISTLAGDPRIMQFSLRFEF